MISAAPPAATVVKSAGGRAAGALDPQRAAVRQVNERLHDLERSRASSDPGSFVCECADTGCAGYVELPLAEYERIRAQGTRFVVLPGHEVADLEQVVEEHGAWLVVRKLGDDVAEAAAR